MIVTAGQPRAVTRAARDRADDSAGRGNQLHLRADRIRPPRRRRARRQPQVQGRPQLRALARLSTASSPRDRRRRSRCSGSSPRSTSGWSTRTRTSSRSCASATTFAGIVGNSGPMQRVYEQVAQVARTNTTVLLRGESGTGKELIAQCDPLQLAAREEAVRQGQLRRAARHADRVGALRLRERRLHRRRRAQEGALRAGRRRDAVPRRDRRRAAVDAGQAAARAAGARIRAARAATKRSRPNVRLIAATNKDLERAIETGYVPRGSLLPAERVPDLHPAAPRAEARRAAARRPLPPALLAPSTAATSAALRRRRSTC